ncbi:MAG: RNA-binding protein [Alphaproteobacteria bacterium]|nr:RNA-binding protein [Alphaproteobacteria bacterium]MDE2493658.1 RNA-binding protein [Alphaproteobacteria bacterium]
MPKGPQGQKRPADIIRNAVHVMRIATGEIRESPSVASPKPGRAEEVRAKKTRKKKAT